jgi:hypothetical protein
MKGHINRHQNFWEQQSPSAVTKSIQFYVRSLFYVPFHKEFEGVGVPKYVFTYFACQFWNHIIVMAFYSSKMGRLIIFKLHFGQDFLDFLCIVNYDF